MSCKLSNNITRDCMYRVAGVKRLYLANFDVANKYEQDADGVISAITLGTGQKYIRWNLLMVQRSGRTI